MKLFRGIILILVGAVLICHPADARRVRGQEDIQSELISATNIVVLLLDGIQITEDDFDKNKPWLYPIAQDLIKDPRTIAEFFFDYLSSVAYLFNENLAELEQQLQKKEGGLYDLLTEKLKKSVTISAGATTLHVFDQKLYQFLDRLLAEKLEAGDYTLTLKCVCCSTGLEPYQLATIVYDRLAFYAESIGESPEEFILRWDINIYAYDISMEALYMTKRGIYDPSSDSFFDDMFAREVIDNFKDFGNYIPCFEKLPDGSGRIRMASFLRGWVKPIYIDLVDQREIANVLLHPTELIIFSSPIAHPLLGMTANINKYLMDFAFNRAYEGLLVTGWGMYKEGLDYRSIPKKDETN